MKKIISTTAVIVVLLLAIPVFASGPGSGRCSCDDSRFEHYRNAVWKKLNLSDEQKVKIEAIRTAAQKDIMPLREKMFDKSVELRRLWLQANPDEEKILSARKEMYQLREAIGVRVTTMRLDIRKVLTPEQSEKLAALHWGRVMGGYGPRGGERGPKVACPGGYF